MEDFGKINHRISTGRPHVVFYRGQQSRVTVNNVDAPNPGTCGDAASHAKEDACFDGERRQGIDGRNLNKGFVMGGEMAEQAAVMANNARMSHE